MSRRHNDHLVERLYSFLSIRLGILDLDPPEEMQLCSVGLKTDRTKSRWGLPHPLLTLCGRPGDTSKPNAALRRFRVISPHAMAIKISFFSPIVSTANIPRAQHMATELSLILDDNSGRFTYSGGKWTLSTLVQWYKGTSWYPGFAGSGSDFGSFTMSFEGTSSLVLCKGLASIYFTFRLRGIGRFHWQYPCAKPFSKCDSFH